MIGFTLQLCTSCWWAAVFLFETAAFWEAAIVWVAAAAACLAAILGEKEIDKNNDYSNSEDEIHTLSNFKANNLGRLRHYRLINLICLKGTRSHDEDELNTVIQMFTQFVIRFEGPFRPKPFSMYDPSCQKSKWWKQAPALGERVVVSSCHLYLRLQYYQKISQKTEML